MGKSTYLTNNTVRSHVPDDLALYILSKLPVKSLTRFGCVQKSWGSLFENPHFMSIYRNIFISNHHSYYDDTSLLLQSSGDDFSLLSGERYENIVKLHCPNPFEQENPWFWILDSGSISGILCLYVLNNEEAVVLWNPSTNEFKDIPRSPLETVSPYQGFVVSLHGFGYDHIREDYKLIRTIHYCTSSTSDWDYERFGMSGENVPREDISNDTFWEEYSLRSNSWRKLDIDNPDVLLLASFTSARLYMDGICHCWYLNYNDPPCYEEKTLVSFDLVNEVLYITQIPLDISPLDQRGAWRYLVGLNGSIALISWFDLSTSFDILVLGELGVTESWTKLFTVGPLSCVKEPIGTGKKGDIFFRKNDGEVVWFDLGSQKIKELGVKGKDDSHVLFYKENLHPIGGKSLI